MGRIVPGGRDDDHRVVDGPGEDQVVDPVARLGRHQLGVRQLGELRRVALFEHAGRDHQRPRARPGAGFVHTGDRAEATAVERALQTPEEVAAHHGPRRPDRLRRGEGNGKSQGWITRLPARIGVASVSARPPGAGRT